MAASYSRQQQSASYQYAINPVAPPLRFYFIGGFFALLLWIVHWIPAFLFAAVLVWSYWHERRLRRAVTLTLYPDRLEVAGAAYPYADMADLWLMGPRSRAPIYSSYIVVTNAAGMVGHGVGEAIGSMRTSGLDAMSASRVRLMLRRKSHSQSVELIYGLDQDAGTTLVDDLARDIGELAGARGASPA